MQGFALRLSQLSTCALNTLGSKQLPPFTYKLKDKGIPVRCAGILFLKKKDRNCERGNQEDAGGGKQSGHKWSKLRGDSCTVKEAEGGRGMLGFKREEEGVVMDAGGI